MNKEYKTNLSAIDYAEKACSTLMKMYQPDELPPKGILCYHQGVFLSGMEQLFFATGNMRYFEYIKGYIDSLLNENGKLKNEIRQNLDDRQAARLLINIYKQTGDEKYKKLLQEIVAPLKKWYVNSKGGFWHNIILPNQMWLDGLYMASSLMAEYASFCGDEQYYDLAVKQAILMADNMTDNRTGLMYHAWDDSKEAMWGIHEKVEPIVRPDPNSGLSPEFWGRAIGWYTVGVLDILEYLPENHRERQRLIQIEKRLLKSLISYQDRETGLWYQVINKGWDPKNWFESSCSSLFTYSIARAVRKGFLEEEYLEAAKKCYHGIIKTFVEENNGDLGIGGISIGTNVGDYNYYINRPTHSYDLHGTGPFVLMCMELNKIGL